MARFLLILLLLLPCSAAFAEMQMAARVLNGKSFVLAGEKTVRLASIEAPNVDEPATALYPARPGEPLGEEAKASLLKLITGKKLRIEPGREPSDRHGRILAQVYLADGTWMQGELLKQGYAMVYSFSDDAHDVIMKMLAAEREARNAKRGIWANPYYRVIAPGDAGEFINRFKIVEGRVDNVHEWHGHVYVNFSKEWRGAFAVFISRKYVPAFGNLAGLTGKTIRVRGWIHYHNAPMIDLNHPEQIEVN